jgi:hypothetical protein
MALWSDSPAISAQRQKAIEWLQWLLRKHAIFQNRHKTQPFSPSFKGLPQKEEIGL